MAMVWGVTGSTARAVTPDQILRPEDHPGTPAGEIYSSYPSVVISGDWLALGMPAVYPRPDTPFSGRVLLWKQEAGRWRPWKALQSHSPAPQVDDAFGTQIVMDGRRMLVTCRQGAAGASVQAFTLSGDTWVPDGRLVMPGKDYDNLTYGEAISLSGNLAAIGSPGGRLRGVDNMGWVDLFERKASGWVHVQRLTDAAPLGPPLYALGFGRGVILTPDMLYVQIGDGVTTFKKAGATWVKYQDLPSPPRGGTDGEITRIKLRGSSLFVHRTGSLEMYLPLEQAQTPTWEYSTANFRGDVHGNTGLWVSDWDNIAVYQRLPNRYWNHEDTLTFSYHGLYYPSQALLTSRQMLITGAPLGGNYQIRVFPRPNHADPQVQLNYSGLVTPFLEPMTSPLEVLHLQGGDYLQGAEVKPLVTFTAFHAGDQPVTLTLGTSGDTADFTLSATTLTVQPGQKAAVSVNFKGTTPGEKRLQLTFTRPGQQTPFARYEVTARSVSAAAQLTFTQHPDSGLYGPYDFAGLHARVTGTGPVTYRWLKDGKPVPGATSANYWPSTGGRYQLEATNPHGSVLSESGYVGFVYLKPNQIVRPGATVKCTILSSGPSFTTQWIDGMTGDLLEDGGSYSGVTTPTLTVRNVQGNAIFGAVVTMPAGPGYPPLTYNLFTDVWGVALPTIDGFAPKNDFSIGQPVRASIATTYEGPIFSGPLFTVTGLPPGLQADASGAITGTATKTGTYQVKVAFHADGMTTAKTLPVHILPHGPPPGIYWGQIPREYTYQAPGAVMLDVTPGGAYTGTLWVGTTRTPLTGSLSATPGISTPERPYPIKIQTQKQVFWFRSLGDGFEFYVRPASLPANGTGTDGTFLALISLIRNRGFVPESSSVGRFNFGLIGGTEDSVAGGHGFGTLNVPASGRATCVGQLPDGSSITGNAWLDEGDNAHFYFVDLRTGTVVYLSSPPSGHCVWLRPAAAGRYFPQGISDRTLSFFKSRYSPQPRQPLLEGDGYHFRINAPGSNASLTPVIFTPAHSVRFGPGTENRLRISMNIYAPTGFFTGQFTQRDADPANLSRTLLRTVSYRGMLMGEHSVGLGYFLIPSLPDPNATPPTTLSTSPILGGSIFVDNGAK